MKISFEWENVTQEEAEQMANTLSTWVGYFNRLAGRLNPIDKITGQQYNEGPGF